MAEKGFSTRGKEDAPGGGYKRNFNQSPRGKFRLSSNRGGKRSRDRSAGARG